MKDLSNSLQSAFLFGIVLSLINASEDATIFFIVLLILSWVKVQYYAKSYVSSVENTYKALKKKGGKPGNK